MSCFFPWGGDLGHYELVLCRFCACGREGGGRRGVGVAIGVVVGKGAGGGKRSDVRFF